MDRRTVLAAIAGGGLLLTVGLAWVLSRSPRARDMAPAWAPSGGALVFVTERDGLTDIGFMQPDGSGRHVVEAAGRESGPVFSRDSSLVVFDSDRNGNREIYVMNADGDGTDSRRLTSHPAEDWGPAWWPDGSRLIFTSNRDAAGGSDIYRMRADGTNVERLTRSGRARRARVSPDATMLALEIDGDVHVLTLADGRLRRLTWAPQDGLHPAWSPDGQRLAFVTRRRGRPEIFTMDLAGNDQQLLVSMARGGATAPRWSPDGTHLAFVHLPDAAAGPLPDPPAGTIYVVELGSGRLTRLSP